MTDITAAFGRSAFKPWTGVNSPIRPATMPETGTREGAMEAGMTRRTMRLPFLGAAAAVVLSSAMGISCTANGSAAFIEGMLPISPDDECLVDGNGDVFVSGALFDIGRSPDDAHALVVAARVVTNLPNTFQAQDRAKSETSSPNYPNYGHADNNTINFTAVEVFLSTDSDRAGAPSLSAPLPLDEANPRRIGVGGTLYNTQAQLNSGAAIISTAITTEDAANLQADPYVSSQIGVAGTAKVLLHVRLVGTTTGAAEIRTPPFVFPVELCQGCLVQDAADCVGAQALVDTGCVRGVDYPTVCQ